MSVLAECRYSTWLASSMVLVNISMRFSLYPLNLAKIPYENLTCIVTVSASQPRVLLKLLQVKIF